MAVISRHSRGLVRQGLFDGDHTISGTTSNTGSPNTPVRRRVRLHQQPTGMVVREVWSVAGTGVYVFDRITAGTYYVTTFDHTGEYGGVIETDIVAEPMP